MQPYFWNIDILINNNNHNKKNWLEQMLWTDYWLLACTLKTYSQRQKTKMDVCHDVHDAISKTHFQFEKAGVKWNGGRVKQRVSKQPLVHCCERTTAWTVLNSKILVCLLFTHGCTLSLNDRKMALPCWQVLWLHLCSVQWSFIEDNTALNLNWFLEMFKHYLTLNDQTNLLKKYNFCQLFTCR